MHGSAPNSYVSNADDCNDTVPEAYTNAIEVCDGIDNDCDGQADEGVLLDWYLDWMVMGMGVTLCVASLYSPIE